MNCDKIITIPLFGLPKIKIPAMVGDRVLLYKSDGVVRVVKERKSDTFLLENDQEVLGSSLRLVQSKWLNAKEFIELAKIISNQPDWRSVMADSQDSSGKVSTSRLEDLTPENLSSELQYRINCPDLQPLKVEDGRESFEPLDDLEAEEIAKLGFEVQVLMSEEQEDVLCGLPEHVLIRREEIAENFTQLIYVKPMTDFAEHILGYTK